MNDDRAQPGDGGWARIPRWILERPKLIASMTASELAVILQVGCLLKRDSWTAFVTTAGLARRCDMTERSAKRAVKSLFDRGVLQRPKRGCLAFCPEPEGDRAVTLEAAKGDSGVTFEGDRAVTIGNPKGDAAVTQRGQARHHEGDSAVTHSRSKIKTSHQDALSRLLAFEIPEGEARDWVARLGEQTIRDVVDSAIAADPGEIRNPTGWVIAALRRAAAGEFEIDVRVRAARRSERESDHITAEGERRRAEYDAARERSEREAAADYQFVSKLGDAEFERALQTLRAARKGTFEGTMIEKAIYEGDPRRHRVVAAGIRSLLERKETVGA